MSVAVHEVISRVVEELKAVSELVDFSVARPEVFFACKVLEEAAPRVLPKAVLLVQTRKPGMYWALLAADLSELFGNVVRACAAERGVTLESDEAVAKFYRENKREVDDRFLGLATLRLAGIVGELVYAPYVEAFAIGEAEEIESSLAATLALFVTAATDEQDAYAQDLYAKLVHRGYGHKKELLKLQDRQLYIHVIYKDIHGKLMDAAKAMLDELNFMLKYLTPIKLK